jgi:predicted XRE-type DNA-binding protein
MIEIPYGYCQCGCGQKTNIAKRTEKRIGHTKGEPLRFVLGHARKRIESVQERFWSKVDQSGGKDGCWDWMASHLPQGYGVLGVNGKSLRSNRVAWELTYGDIPAGLCVCHHCDNPACCNPKHLFLGTMGDNMKDKIRKGRQTKGEELPQSKLTLDQVQRIRHLYSEGHLSQREIAGIYGVVQGNVSMIVHNKIWRKDDYENDV